MLELVVLIVSIVTSLLVGSSVFLRNTKNRTNRVYALVAVCLILYPLFNYLSLQTDNRLLLIRLVIAFSTLAVGAIYFLAWSMRYESRRFGALQITGWLATAGVAVMDMTPIVFSGLQGSVDPVPVPGPGIIFFLLHFVVFLVLTAVLLIKSMVQTTGDKRQHYTLMLTGVTPILVLSPITGFVLPVAFKNASLVFLSPLYGTFFVTMIGYAIAKHKLFDIQSVLARYVGYLFTLVVLAGVYGLAVTLLARHLFDIELSLGSQLFFVAATAIVGLIFQPVKSLFDSLTKRVFYQDAYEPQKLYDELNKLLVSSLDVSYLMRHGADIIGAYLKIESCVICLEGIGGSRVFGASQPQTASTFMVRANPLLSKVRHNIIIRDDLGSKDAVLREEMQRAGVAVIVRLSQSTKRSQAGFGYMLLGAKKNGHTFNEQDESVLQSVANELVIAIQNALHYEEIQQFNVALQSKVDEATRKLRRTNEKLKALDEAKDDFVSMASHQLRTPLTSIKGYTSMVLEGDAGKINATQRQLLEQSFASSQRMVYLIADLLNVSRLKTGKFIIEKMPVNIAEVVHQEIGQLTEVAASRSLELKYDMPEAFPTLELDETKTRQVIMNFIDNAIYYTPSGGHIRVETNETPTTVEFKVIDDGIGVPKAERQHLFTKFYRAGNARTARPDGTGLGLYMARKVVVAQGGAIIFETEEGKGSTFGFIFPKTIAAKVD